MLLVTVIPSQLVSGTTCHGRGTGSIITSPGALTAAVLQPWTTGPSLLLSVSLQGLDKQVVQAAHHGPGVIDQPCCDHGIFIDLKGKMVTLFTGGRTSPNSSSGTF